MRRETKATAISLKVKQAVRKRDKGLCVICGKPGEPVAHIVRRSQLGMGVEQNIVTLCPRCHYAFDEGLYMRDLEPLGFHTRGEVKEFLYSYMESLYPGWTPESVTYKKFKAGPHRSGNPVGVFPGGGEFAKISEEDGELPF